MYNETKKEFDKKLSDLENYNLRTQYYLDYERQVKEKTDDNWKFNWIVQENDKGAYIEYYGIHAEGIHLHGRIYDDGREEPLDVLKKNTLFIHLISQAIENVV